MSRACPSDVNLSDEDLAGAASGKEPMRFVIGTLSLVAFLLSAVQPRLRTGAISPMFSSSFALFLGLLNSNQIADSLLIESGWCQ